MFKSNLQTLSCHLAYISWAHQIHCSIFPKGSISADLNEHILQRMYHQQVNLVSGYTMCCFFSRELVGELRRTHSKATRFYEVSPIASVSFSDSLFVCLE